MQQCERSLSADVVGWKKWRQGDIQRHEPKVVCHGMNKLTAMASDFLAVRPDELNFLEMSLFHIYLFSLFLLLLSFDLIAYQLTGSHFFPAHFDRFVFRQDRFIELIYSADMSSAAQSLSIRQ